GERFAANLEARDANLALAESETSPYVLPTGKASVKAQIAGALVDGKARNMSGKIEATTSGMMLNKESFGDLIATARLQGTKISGSAHPTGDAGLYLDQ